jgi:hypothetical protein
MSDVEHDITVNVVENTVMVARSLSGCSRINTGIAETKDLHDSNIRGPKTIASLKKYIERIVRESYLSCR